ncbi:MAG TPA: hypothetical protein VFV03_08120, partial [Solirubrobacteraceae bacterium]|nr:hypothetical protein [Solirubrobacteraceae bacterium]
MLASLLAVAIAPAMLRTLSEGGQVRPNYRDRPLPFPFGVVSLAGALLALIPLALVQRLGLADVFRPETPTVVVYALGVAFL